MKLASKIAASVALLGAVATTRAASITFGVNIPPIASLVVRDGVLKDPASMFVSAAAPAATDAIVVGGFTVVTNMPKWNIYFNFANNGKLENQTGGQIKDNAGAALWLGTSSTAAPGATDASVWLSTSDKVAAQDDEAAPLAIAATLPLATATAPMVSPTNLTLTSAIAALTAGCTGAAPCVFTAPWLYSTDLTTATFDINTIVGSAATGLGNVAGTYTETMYLTLVTSY